MTQAAWLDCSCLQYQKKKKLVTLVTQAARLDCSCLQFPKEKNWSRVVTLPLLGILHFAMINDGHLVLTQLIQGDQSVIA